MTTTNETPVVQTTPIQSVIKRDYAWFTQHILLLAFIALLVGGSVYGVNSIIARHDAANSTKFEQILATQVAETKSLQQQMAADQAANDVRDAAYQKTISTLSQSIVQRDANAKKQVAVDSTLDASAAAARLVQQTNAAPNEVTVAGSLVTMDLPITRDVVTALDNLVRVTGDLQDTQGQLTAQIGLTADANKNLTDAKSVISSQTIQIADQVKSCNAQIATVKAKARKSKFKWFIVGYVAGFVSGVTVLVK